MSPDRVWMTHPDLPGQRIHVRPAGVAVRQASGWQFEVEADEAAVWQAQVDVARALLSAAGWTLIPPAEPTAAEEPQAQPEPRRRRRAETEGE